MKNDTLAPRNKVRAGTRDPALCSLGCPPRTAGRNPGLLQADTASSRVGEHPSPVLSVPQALSLSLPARAAGSSPERRATHLKAASDFSKDVLHGHPGVLEVDLAGWKTRHPGPQRRGPGRSAPDPHAGHVAPSLVQTLCGLS